MKLHEAGFPASVFKMTKARKPYTCHYCKGAISKGDFYRKKTVSVGQPWKDDKIIKMAGGGIAFEAQGFSCGVQVCEYC